MKIVCLAFVLAFMAHQTFAAEEPEKEPPPLKPDFYKNLVMPGPDVQSLGCWNDNIFNRAIYDDYTTYKPEEAVQKCYERAKSIKASIFGVQFNTQCFTSTYAEHTFEKYGQPPFGLGCANGRGGISLNDIYRIDYHPKYRWKKTVGFCIDCIGRSDGVGIADVFQPNAVACLGLCEDTWNTTACQYHSDRWCTVFTTAEMSHGEVHNGVARGDGTAIAACWAVDHCKNHKPPMGDQPASLPVDNSQCLKSVQTKGCYNTKSLFKRGQNLVFWRYKIDWKNLAQFASNLACECAKKARAAGVEYFGLHFYGECWALTKSDIVMASNGDCTQASDMTKKCTDKWNSAYSSECIGYKSYFVYKILKDGEVPEPTIMV